MNARQLYTDFYRLRRAFDDTEYANLCAYLSPSLKRIVVNAEISYEHREDEDPLLYFHARLWIARLPQLRIPEFERLDEALKEFNRSLVNEFMPLIERLNAILTGKTPCHS